MGVAYQGICWVISSPETNWKVGPFPFAFS